MEGVPEPPPEESLPDRDFGLGVFPANAGHHPAAGFGVYDIGHQATFSTFLLGSNAFLLLVAPTNFVFLGSLAIAFASKI